MGKILIGESAREFSFPSVMEAIRGFYEKNGKNPKTRREVKKFILKFFGEIQRIEII